MTKQSDSSMSTDGQLRACVCVSVCVQAALLSPTQQCEVLQLALRQYFDGRLTPIEEDQIELQGTVEVGRGGE